MEAVFAVLGGWLLLQEAMTPRMLGGCTLMLAAMILAQLRRRQRRGVQSGRRAELG